MANNNAVLRVRPSSRCKRVLCFLLVIVFAFSLLSMLATAAFFRWVLPKLGSETRGLAMQYSSVDPDAYPRREIRFPAEGGSLQGYLYGEENSNGIILLAHGMNSNADRHLPETLYFVEQGWCVFVFDGAGSADVSSANSLLQMKRDVLAALQWLFDQPALAKEPVVLYGHSLGAYAVALAAAEEPRVRAVVCIAGFNSPIELMYSFAEERCGILAAAEYPFLYLYNWLAFGQDVETTAVERINALKIPVLIVQGTSDELLPWELTLASHREEITNPYVEYLLIDEPYRNGHSSTWLSRAAGEYACEIRQQLSSLHEQYGNSLPEEVLQGFLAEVDMVKLNELDEPFMAYLQTFVCAAVNCTASD